jgi:hypothetical protein
MKKSILFVTIAALLSSSAFLSGAAYSQGQSADTAKQLKSGEWIQLGKVNVRALRGTKTTFKDVKLTGSPVEVLLEFDSAKSAAVSYKLTPDAKSDIYLLKGEQKIAPVAVIEDFPSWGADNDKEVEVLDPKDSIGDVTLNFAQKGSVSLLFDVPAEQGKAPQTFKLMIKAIKANNEKFSFVVSL